MSKIINSTGGHLNNSVNKAAPYDISYRLNFERFLEHLVDVTLTFTADTDAPCLWLPAWIPGSYLMREFARHITAVHYQIEDKENNNASYATKQRAQKNR